MLGLKNLKVTGRAVRQAGDSPRAGCGSSGTPEPRVYFGLLASDAGEELFHLGASLALCGLRVQRKAELDSEEGDSDERTHKAVCRRNR